MMMKIPHSKRRHVKFSIPVRSRDIVGPSVQQHRSETWILCCWGGRWQWICRCVVSVEDLKEWEEWEDYESQEIYQNEGFNPQIIALSLSLKLCGQVLIMIHGNNYFMFLILITSAHNWVKARRPRPYKWKRTQYSMMTNLVWCSQCMLYFSASSPFHSPYTIRWQYWDELSTYSPSSL